MEGRRQSIFDKISSDLVKRITQSGPDTPFDSVMAEQMVDSVPDSPAQTGSEAKNDVQPDSAFKYTVIDEHNQKFTNTLPVHRFGLVSDTTDSLGASEHNDDTIENLA